LTAGLGLRPSQDVTLGRLLEGTLSAKTWLSTPEADQLLRGIRIGCVPRDVQLVTRDGQPTVGAESVHAFLHAPLFWWLVSNLWCISIGRLLDPELGDNIKGYRLHPQFIDDPAHYGVMFRNKNDSYDDWKDFASASAADLPGQTRAVSTLDIRDFYYSITTTPSAITSAFEHSLDVAPDIPQTTAALTHLLDAVHHQFAKRFAALRPRGDSVHNPIPLPVGPPSSQVLANLVIALGVADLEKKPEIDSVAAYADDLMVISRSLPEMEEDSAEYLARLQVVDPESHKLQSPLTSPLATLYARLDKSATFYLRSSPGDGLAGDEPDEGTMLDPYLEGEPSPEWGGRLRTVLRAPHKRDRVPRELTSDIRRLVDEIRIGLAPEEAQERIVAIIDELDDAMFLALRPYWTDLLVAAIAALGSKAAIELTDEFVKVAESLAAAPLQCRDA
jgi:hypothetical protein